MKKAAFILFGQVKNYNEVQHKQFTSLISPSLQQFDTDFYLVTTPQHHYHNPRNDEDYEIDHTSINSFFKFQDVVLDDVLEKQDEINNFADYLVNKLKFRAWGPDSLMSTQNSLKQLYSLNYFYDQFKHKQHEYDYFVVARSDIFYTHSLIIPELKQDSIYVPDWGHHGKNKKSGGCNDRFCIITSDRILQLYCSRYSALRENIVRYHAETYLQQTLINNNIHFDQLKNFKFVHLRANNELTWKGTRKISSKLTKKYYPGSSHENEIQSPDSQKKIRKPRQKKHKVEINKLYDLLNFRADKDYIQMFDANNPKKMGLHPHLAMHFNAVLKNRTIYQNPNSRHILCNGIGGMKKLREFVESSDLDFEKLVCMGFDKGLSVWRETLQSVRHRFKKIYYEAKDMDCDWVQTLPMGVSMRYLKRAGVGNVLQQLEENENNPKDKLIACAYGSRWPIISTRIGDRKKLSKFVRESNVIEDMFCDPKEYFGRLCDYRFFACPVGLGIQTPKVYESLICKTVPVVTDHHVHRELRDIYGLPLLIVSEWDQLTEEFLNDQWDSKYRKIDWHEEHDKFSVYNFQDFLNK